MGAADDYFVVPAPDRKTAEVTDGLLGVNSFGQE